MARLWENWEGGHQLSEGGIAKILEQFCEEQLRPGAIKDGMEPSLCGNVGTPSVASCKTRVSPFSWRVTSFLSLLWGILSACLSFHMDFLQVSGCARTQREEQSKGKRPVASRATSTCQPVWLSSHALFPIGTGVQVSLWYDMELSKYIPRGKIAWLHSNSIFFIFEKSLIGFYNICINL